MIKKERFVWIDYAKFITIFLVVFFHTNPDLLSNNFLGKFLGLIRMPAFFLIAGYLFRVEKFESFISFVKHRSKQLLVPYVSFFIIFYILWLCIGRNIVGESEIAISILLPIKEFIMGTPSIICAPYWFITCLFSMQIIYYLVNRLCKKRKLIFFFCMVLSLSSYFINIDFWLISKAFNYLPFYAFSNLFKDYIKNIEFKVHYKYVILFLFLVITSLAIFKEIDNIMYVILGLLILPFYICCCKVLSKFGKNNIIEMIAKNGIIILALQNYVIGIIKILSNKILGYNILYVELYYNVVVTIIVLLLLYYPIIFINKYIPFIIGKGNFFDKN